MIIDCDSCEVRGLACGDCVVTVLLGSPPGGADLGYEEQQAIEVLAGTGLVPPLRLVRAEHEADALKEAPYDQHRGPSARRARFGT